MTMRTHFFFAILTVSATSATSHERASKLTTENAVDRDTVAWPKVNHVMKIHIPTIS